MDRPRFVAGIIHGERGMVKVVHEDGRAEIMTWKEWKSLGRKLAKADNAGRAGAEKAA